MSRRHRYDIAFYVPWMTPLLSRTPLKPTGGAETQVLLLSRALAKSGLSVCLIVFDAPGADLPSSANRVDVVVRPPYYVGRSTFGRLREIAAMGAAIRGVDADVFVSRSAGYHVGLVGLWAKLARRKFVYSSASLRDFDYQSFFEKWSDRIGFRVGLALADAIVVQTEEQVHLCERRFGRKSVLIRSISESAEQFDGRPEAFLWVGRVDRNKQPLEFVQLARSLPEARFQMVAKRLANTESGQLWDQIEAAALTLPNLDLLPSRPWPALLDLIARSVAVVSTSAFEGMPNVFLEGWARGVPALALNHDPDGVINRYGLGGFARGRPGRLIELASDLWANETARSECAARCREYVSLRHSSEVIGAKWERALPFSDESARRPVAMEAG